ncbi:hypothetical protein GOODEAATRI_000558 [Goodea atripinnis]|uniref:Uncharacterized protein n=1 Tax=Goodea atripinnis TaxID=208336 RepID=A0ABV0NR17_9TELE
MEKPQVEGINTANHSLHLLLHLCFLNPLNHQLVTPQCTQRGMKIKIGRKSKRKEEKRACCRFLSSEIKHFHINTFQGACVHFCVHCTVYLLLDDSTIIT